MRWRIPRIWLLVKSDLTLSKLLSIIDILLFIVQVHTGKKTGTSNKGELTALLNGKRRTFHPPVRKPCTCYLNRTSSVLWLVPYSPCVIAITDFSNPCLSLTTFSILSNRFLFFSSFFLCFFRFFWIFRVFEIYSYWLIVSYIKLNHL